jgi:hypothetical protein
MVGYVGPQARVLSLSSYVWNLGTLHFPTTRNPDQADQLMHSPHPRCQWYHKYRESCTDLLYQWENFVTAYCIYLHSPPYYYPTSTRSEKVQTMPSYQPTESNKIDNKKSYGSIDMWILIGLMFNYLLQSMIPPLWRIQKELPPQFLSLTSRNCRKASPIKSCTLIT